MVIWTVFISCELVSWTLVQWSLYTGHYLICKWITPEGIQCNIYIKPFGGTNLFTKLSETVNTLFCPAITQQVVVLFLLLFQFNFASVDINGAVIRRCRQVPRLLKESTPHAQTHLKKSLPWWGGSSCPWRPRSIRRKTPGRWRVPDRYWRRPRRGSTGRFGTVRFHWTRCRKQMRWPAWRMGCWIPPMSRPPAAPNQSAERVRGKTIAQSLLTISS